MGTVSQTVNQYFTLQDQIYQEGTHDESHLPQNVLDGLREKSPPSPIFAAKIQWTKVFVSMALDLATYGTVLTLTYAFSAKVFRKISGKVNPPPLTSRIWKTSLMLLPVVAYRCIQIIVGLIVHPISFPFARRIAEIIFNVNLDQLRAKIFDKDFRPMRFSARSGLGHTIDAVFLKNTTIAAGEGENPLQGRCIVLSVGNMMAYESLVSSDKVYRLAKRLNANLLVYNYAGVIGSSGVFPNQDAIVASHSVMLDFLEALGSKEIVDFGWSIGGGVQWKDHSEKTRDEARYCNVSYKTFLSIKRFGEMIAGNLGAFGVPFLRWNYDSEAAMEDSKIRKVVVQSGKRESGIKSDGVILADNALGQKATGDELVYSRTDHNTLLYENEIEEIAQRVEAHFTSMG